MVISRISWSLGEQNGFLKKKELSSYLKKKIKAWKKKSVGLVWILMAIE